MEPRKYYPYQNEVEKAYLLFVVYWSLTGFTLNFHGFVHNTISERAWGRGYCLADKQYTSRTQFLLLVLDSKALYLCYLPQIFSVTVLVLTNPNHIDSFSSSNNEVMVHQKIHRGRRKTMSLISDFTRKSS